MFNKLNTQKALLHIRNYGFRSFVMKVKGKIVSAVKSFAGSSDAKDHPAVNFIRQKIAPLNLEVEEREEKRVNILISIIDFRYFFGGYIGVFNLAKKLTAEGLRVRMVIVDECRYEPDLWRKEIRKYEGLEDFFDQVEVLYAYSRAEPVRVNRKDVFIATSWWTAHVANYARKYMNAGKFLYLIQEYEPVFYPMGTFTALALESYTFPHYALFSTNLLREYFRQNGLGVYRNDQDGGESSVAVENAILKFAPEKSSMTNRRKRKLLFYARPEEHASRNMFEIGMLALSNLIMGGHLGVDDWEMYGIGSVDRGRQKITVYDRAYITLLPKLSLQEYKELLPEFDVGLSLMFSPHPSIVPLEMAAAGMLVVTNTYANKTAESLKNISSNIFPAGPTIEGIEKALVAAIQKVDDYDYRIKGAQVNWSQNWEDTYNPDMLARIKGFISDIAG